ncbi:MAG: type II toxin-antitoxin system Phd/YefM family antitoxin [Spirochaetia bacterium]|jgi:prevent-host-death family protein|nr:type II toxin-antitoxin system Phd/YefM family antitoxin [Spirochaetia bacterium]
MKLSESIQPISYLKAHASEIIRSVAEKRETLIITQNGRAKAVIQDIHLYEETQESLALLKILAKSNKQLQENKEKKADEVFENLEKRINNYNEIN